ncbi:MAG: hypothetical protein JSU05_01250 [Bacteroidetes bacterium]|nr:hypothetical protein [Bacteroidota bacterium]
MATFQSYIIYRKEWAVKWFSAIIILIALGFISDKYLNSRALAILFVVLLMLPFVFIKSMMNYFTRKATIRLDAEEISFDISKLGNEDEQQNEKYQMHNISCYQIQFPNNRFSCLILKFKSGNKKEFSFHRKKISDEQSDTDLIIETVHKTFEQHDIEFLPSFYASQKGLYTIIFLLILVCIAVGISIYSNKNLPLTIIGSMLLIGQVVSRRMSDMSFYKKWKNVQ